ncbi:MAG: bifunctional lysylphosphatidylglycerol flippase/synthetase MprF [Gaiellaceae bacterium]
MSRGDRPAGDSGCRPRFVRVERHSLGPRLYLFGVRCHEWHLGVLILVALGIGALVGPVHDGFTSLLAVAAAGWLIMKDWRDLTRRRRDTGAWRVGLHRPPASLRRFSRAEPLPLLAATGVAVVALVNLLSALTPNIRWRGHLLLKVEPLAALHVFHALAIPASIALLVSAYYLYRRRLRALQLAVLLLAALGIFNLFKGLDFEEAAADFALVLLLVAGRRSFYVRHEPVTRRAAVLRVPLVAGAAFAVSLALVAAVAHAPFTVDVRETWHLLLWQSGPLTLHDEAARLDPAVGLIGVAALMVIAYLLFRPLAAPRALPSAEVRAAAAELVRRHGFDTLAYFKLRRDKHYLFSEDGRAFLGYRVESGVLVVSGDPVGATGAVPGLLRALAVFAEQRGLRIAALGVSEQLRPLFEELGLRALYMGDEAIVETRSFSLEGRAIRKVRQSVSRAEKAGYTTELVEVGQLDDTTFAALERLSETWRGGAAERGFSMAMDALRRDGEHDDTLLLIARDGDGCVRGYLHFVPSFGRAAASLSLMRRDPETPNGLTEFMIVEAIEELRARGIDEVSLNFAAFARFIHDPQGLLERAAGRLARRADAVFQIERLYRFNAKFFPRWEPRYAMYEGLAALPRFALASLWLEGQIPKPTLSRVPREPARH